MEGLLEKLQRAPESHKGQNGKVAIIAGSADYTGAPALDARAALRTGCDLTKILTSKAVGSTVASYSENFIVRSYPTDYFSQKALTEAKKFVDWSDALVIGPGMGDPEPGPLQRVIEYAEKPKVIDADAIEVALGCDFRNAIFTPHEKEAEPIIDNYGSLEKFTEREDAVVLLKGKKDRIYVDGERKINETGHPTMTVGGTGDVLAGIVGSLVSQGLENEEAAELGAWLNGKAGEKAAEEYGEAALATDIIEEIPKVLKQ
jgi:ADP-dependent NAD(P)H-hydrate dehydratase